MIVEDNLYMYQPTVMVDHKFYISL